MSKPRFKIGTRWVGEGEPCFIIAEMSANHKQDFDTAVKIIRAAKKAGADAIKLQTYTPDTLTIDSHKRWFRVGGKDNPQAWKGKTLYNLYQEAYMPWEWHCKLKKLAEKLGLILFSTPYDFTAVKFLQSLKIPCYKIASYEATNLPFLKKVAQTNKPILMSVGFATLGEIKLSVKALRAHGTKHLALLQCATSYSDKARPEATNLRTMLDLSQRFDAVCGFSDNMGGIQVPVLAAAMGAAIIEKHFVVSHDKKSLDDKFSLDQKSFKQMVDHIRWQEKVMGKVKYGPQTKAEKYNRQFRRSLFVVENMKKGEPFTPQNIRSIRPAYGLETKFLESVLGKKANRDIERGTPLSRKLIKS